MHSVMAFMKGSRTGPLVALAVLWLLVSAEAGCDRAVHVKNNSSKAASVYVSIPEGSGKQLVRVGPNEDGAADLGKGGVYTVYVMADDIVTGALTKTRDDLEAKLKTATSPNDVKDLTEKLKAIKKFADQLTQRATSCGGKVAGEGDAYVNVGWDDAQQKFTAVCISKSPEN